MCLLVGASMNAGTEINQNGIEMPSVRIIGHTASMLDIEDKTITLGRFFSDAEVERSAKVCVIGTDLQDKFFPNQNPIGQTIKVRGVPLLIIGVEEKRGSFFGDSMDRNIYIPLTIHNQIFNRTGGLQIHGKAANGEILKETIENARLTLRNRRELLGSEEDTFSVVNTDEFGSQMDQFTGAIAAVVLPITAIILVVGGAALGAQSAPAGRRTVLMAVTAAALLLRPAIRVTLPAFHSYQWQELRPLVRQYESAGHDEPVYVFANAVPAWLFYTPDWEHPDRARLAWYTRMASVGGPAFENAPPRPHAVASEGEGLEYRAGRRREIVGISTGDQWRVLVGSRNGRPDEGWAENESRRIVAAAEPSIWLVFSHYRGSENLLFDRIEAQGLVQDLGQPAKGAHLFRYTRTTTAMRRPG
jgi:hypothetical protein